MQPTTYKEVDSDISRALSRPGRVYWLVLGLLFLGVVFGGYCWGHSIAKGLGVWNIRHPTVWAIDLTMFVFWVGIAHSGTLISAILYLFRASWRTTISRSAEAMTVFAVTVAGLWPLIHLGRVWVVYWILPYPNQRNLWPNFQSPLVFDVVAISTYLTVSALFWYTGMVPDLVTLRDTMKGLRSKVYAFFSLNFEGRIGTWRNYGTAYLLFAALATPLVISVHSVVSWDFALGIIPGWHSTIFAPYFVAGAIHSGLAMVLTLLVPMRRIFGFEHHITKRVLDQIAKTIIFTGLIVGYSYLVEFFLAWYSNNRVEWDVFVWRTNGYYAVEFWIMVFCNTIAPLAFFFKRIRISPAWLFGISILINIGMFFERYVIIISSVAHEYDPYSWGIYPYPTWVEFGIMGGSFCLFFLMFMLFAKFVPTISIAEVKEGLPPPMRRRKAGAPEVSHG